MKYYGYYCRVCKTDTKNEEVQNCSFCDYEVCLNCPYFHICLFECLKK